MNGNVTAIIAFVLWGVVYVLSFLIAANTAATDMGLTRGWNRITTFLGWQIVAALLAIVVWVLGLRFDEPLWRWIFRIPALLAIGLVLLVTVTIMWANYSKPKPIPAESQPTRPTTQAAPPIDPPD